MDQSAIEKELEGIEPLILANDRKNFIRHGAHGKPATLLRQEFMELCPPTAIDEESLKTIQVLQLHQAVDHTQSAAGSAALLRSLICPSTDLHYIRSKQESLREIGSNDKLRQALGDLVHEYAVGESALYNFFNKGLNASLPYLDLKRAKSAAAGITGILQTIPEAESAYLASLISRLRSYRGSPIDRMMNGSIYKTFTGLKSGGEVGPFTPKIRFSPRHFTKWAAVGPVAAIVPYIYNHFGFEPALPSWLPTIGWVWAGACVFYGLFIKPIRDTDQVIEPLRRRCIDDDAFGQAIDAVGMIDELLSCHDFAKELSQAATLPEIADEDHHFFEANGLRSPVLIKDNPDFVPNDVRLSGTKLTFISGPNSGGKTTLCKSIVHNQLLAQMGSCVAAEKASVNIADTIAYQAPKFDGLEDEQGRFGTELARTRDIFYATSPRSLVILDELAQGTTHEETLRESFEILSDFHSIGNNTVLVTHNHSLVDRFMDEKKGQCLMVEFHGDTPTYRIVPGISRVSHAGRVAREINFSREDRRRYMKEKGYI